MHFIGLVWSELTKPLQLCTIQSSSDEQQGLLQLWRCWNYKTAHFIAVLITISYFTTYFCLLSLNTVGHFTYWISPFAQRKRCNSQTSSCNYHGHLHVLKYLLLLLSGDRRPSDVAYSTSALNSKTKRPRRRNFAQGYPRSYATPTPTSRSKGQKSRSLGRGILWLPPSRTACCICTSIK